MFCGKCGTKLNDDALFCTQCGTSVPGSPVAGESASQAQLAPQEQNGAPSQPLQQPQSIASENSLVVDGDNQSPTSEIAQTEKDKPKKGIIIAIVSVVIVALICGVVGYNLWNAEQERLADERYTEVASLVDELLEDASIIKPNTGEGADRAVLLEEYQVLSAANIAVMEAQENGDLTLMNGEAYDVSAEMADIRAKIDKIHDWFVQYYKGLLADYSYPDGTTADSISSADCQTKLDQLASLLTLLKDEIAIWDGNTDAGSDYAALVDAVNAQIAKGNELLPLIAAREDEERRRAEEDAKQNGFIGKWTRELEPTSLNLQINADGTGFSRFGSYTSNFTWKKTDVVGNYVHVSLHFPDATDQIEYNMQTQIIHYAHEYDYIRYNG